MVTAKMVTRVGAQIITSAGHDHNHEPAPRYGLGVRQFFNSIRKRGVDENIAPNIIVDQETQM
ncbi:RING-type domain-containing protein, partial [Aphis craccivora]